MLLSIDAPFTEGMWSGILESNTGRDVPTREFVQSTECEPFLYATDPCQM